MQIGVKEISQAGENIAFISAPYSRHDLVARFARCARSNAHALRARHDRRRLCRAAIQRGFEQNLNVASFSRGEEAVSTRTLNLTSTLAPRTAAKSKADEDSSREDADARKLAVRLEEMRQTLMRRQADFDNYRKRSKRSARTMPSAPPLASSSS